HPLLGDLVEQPASAAEPRLGHVAHGGAVPVGASGRDPRLHPDLRRRGARANARAAGPDPGRGAAAQEGAGSVRESLDPWPFVIAAYALVVGATVLLVAWSWIAMRRAE